MKKIIPVLFTLAIVCAVFPLHASAIWWNPFTWEVFKTKSEVVLPSPSPVDVSKITDTPTSTSTIKTEVENVTPKSTSSPIAPIKNIPAIAPTTPTQSSDISEMDRKAISGVVSEFVAAVHNKQASRANALVSAQSKSYFENVLNLARTARKDSLLSQNFSTVFAVILIRLSAASSTLEIHGEDIIPQAVNLGSSPYLDAVNFNKLQYTFKAVTPNTVAVVGTYGGKEITTVTVLRENGSWKIDYVSIFKERNAKTEQEIVDQAAKSGKTRQQTMEALLTYMLGSSNIQLNYLIWVPLNERGDLKADNAKFQSFSDPLHGYSIDFPEHWEMDFVDASAFYIAPYATDGIRPNIVVTFNMKPEYSELERYSKYLAELLPKEKTDISGDIQRVKTTFQGETAYKLTYDRLRTFDGGRTYVKQQNQSLVFFRNDIIYLVEYRNGIKDYEKTLPLAMRSIETMRFKKPCTTKTCMTF